MSPSSLSVWHPSWTPARVFWWDLGRGLVSVLKSALALVGIVTLTLAVYAASHPEVRATLTDAVQSLRGTVFGVAEATGAADDAASDAAAEEAAAASARPDALASTAAALPLDQRAATDYLAHKYRLAPDAIAVFVAEAFRTGQELKLDPLLLLAVMSVESSMNPFAQSAVGAQGLMQVMPTVHADRFAEFGGPHAALHPVANIRVGAEILKEYVQRFGSVEDGLRAYVGSGQQDNDNGYGARVLGERARLESIVKRAGQSHMTMRPVSAAAPIDKTVGKRPGA